MQNTTNSTNKSDLSIVKPIVALVVIYFFGNILLLLNRGVYWDGRYFFYLLENGKFDILWAHLAGVKLFSLYYVIRFVGLFPYPMFAIKVLAFLSWFIAGISLFIVLNKKATLHINEAFFISCSFLLIPSFPVKAELSVLYYSLCNMLFFLGALAYFTAERLHNKLLTFFTYLVSGILFFLSFFTNSFLVFYGGFLLFALCGEYKNNSEKFITVIKSWIKKNIFFILLPLAFWALKIALGKPEVAYNEFVFLQGSFLSGFIKNLWNGVSFGFFWPLIAPIIILQRKIFAGLFVVTLLITYVLTKHYLKDDTNGENVDTNKRSLSYIILGIFFFFLGLAPYLAVDKAPHIFGYGFSMRHALLLPLGSSFIILGIILSLIRNKWHAFVQVTLLALFITFSVYNYFALDMDWYRQRAIVEALNKSETSSMQKTSTLIISDKAGGYKYQDRNIEEFEYQVYANEALSPDNFKFVILLGNEKIAAKEMDNVIKEKYQAFLDTHMFPVPSSFDPHAKPVAVDIISQATQETFTIQEWLQLKKYELFFSQERFLQKIRDDFKIEIITI